ncbi:putative HTH-type transcriptional regulator YfiR [Actinomadura rubteroloni]|uniref:Putative HTH-type transcriptional regulator YfiR n=1 Tax=Actinomadura rubteroloni TaxID=1926885 RepID=A0A2P4UFP5_9ACTN|nr:TetR/AcrR family transcriptional regulator [Actinomadura rubteroloni]POM23862.1 putative HTH-type transcriptional regulator YfiR [Actinomadura rubteroloni]
MTQPKSPWAARTARAGRDHETRTLLLSCAEKVFARLGYARTTVADITAEAHVSRATFYVYFASREDVFRAVAGRVRDAFLAAHEIPDAGDHDGLARASIAAFLSAVAEHRELLTVLEHQALADPAIAAIVTEIRERPLRRGTRYVERLTARGEARPAASPRAVAEAAYAMIDRFARTIDGPAAFERALDDVTAMYLRLLFPDRP